MRSSYWSSDVCSSDLKRCCSSLSALGSSSIFLRLAPAFFSDRDRRFFPISHLEDGIFLHHQIFGERRRQLDRKSVVSGKSVSVRVHHGGRRIIKKKTNNKYLLIY